jgi:hypothetical protein
MDQETNGILGKQYLPWWQIKAQAPHVHDSISHTAMVDDGTSVHDHHIIKQRVCLWGGLQQRDQHGLAHAVTHGSQPAYDAEKRCCILHGHSTSSVHVTVCNQRRLSFQKQAGIATKQTGHAALCPASQNHHTRPELYDKQCRCAQAQQRPNPTSANP